MANNNTALNLEWLNLLAEEILQEKALSREAVVVYSSGLDRIVWANISGASLFGGASICDFMAAKFDPGHPFLRQLTSAVRQLGEERIYRGFRVVDEGRSRLLQCEIGLVELQVTEQHESGEKVIIVTCANPAMGELQEHEFAQTVVENLTGFGDARAVCDEYGLVISATDEFAETEILPEAMEKAFVAMGNEAHASLSVATERDDSILVKLYLLGNSPKRFLVLADISQQEITEGIAQNETDVTAKYSKRVAEAVTAKKEIENESPVEQSDEASESLSDETNADNTNKGLVGGMVAGVAAASTAIFGRRDNSDLASQNDEPISLQIDETEKENHTASEDAVQHDTTTQSDVPEDEAPSSDNEDDLANIDSASTEDSGLDDGKNSVEKQKNDDRQEEFVFSGDSDPVRFAWTTDTEQVFTSLSPELASAVGPNAADIVGRKWTDVATVFGFDSNGEIHSLLKKQDTWSGKSVLWPIQGTDLQVPVDLAALPSFSSGRNFDGFRGFGIVRMLDTIVDPEEAGLALVSAGIAQAEDDELTNIVELKAHRETATNELTLNDGEDNGLSNGENKAFHEIGRKLRDTSKYDIPQLHSNDGDFEKEVEKPDDNEIAVNEDMAVEQTNDSPTARVDTSLLEDLPVPVMVYRGDETLFANRELLALTGYSDFSELRQAGGIKALFNQDNSDEISDESETILSDKDGGQMRVKALLQSVPWDNERALLLSFRQPKHENLPANEKIVLDMMRVSELQNILDTATDGIIILSKDGIVQSINQSAEALFGRSDKDISKKPVSELFASESHNTIDKYLSNLGDPGAENILNDGREVIGVEAKGGLIPLYVTIGKIGASEKYCAVLRDMTPWKKTREELIDARKQAEDASDQKTEFLARVSHEIRTPLNAIIGFSDVMIEERFGPVDNDRYREYLRDINRSGVHVLDLINDLLDISKIEAGKMELSFEAVDLNKIVAETVALLQPQANGNRVLIRTSLSRAVPKVVADARSIRQIVLNLVSNAIKFTGANGQVIVSTVYEGNGEVALRVRDTGRGMTDEEIVIALKPFRQVNAISETRGQGTGLGLPLTKALVEANKAYLDIESEPGEGTIIHIQFPTQRVLAD